MGEFNAVIFRLASIPDGSENISLISAQKLAPIQNHI